MFKFASSKTKPYFYKNSIKPLQRKLFYIVFLTIFLTLGNTKTYSQEGTPKKISFPVNNQDDTSEKATIIEPQLTKIIVADSLKKKPLLESKIKRKAIMYADKITNSMQKTIDETNYRRQKQIDYNTKHGLAPKALNKSLGSALGNNSVSTQYYENQALKAAEPESLYLSKPEIEKKIRDMRKMMEKAAKELDFMQAAKLRDDIKALQEKL